MCELDGLPGAYGFGDRDRRELLRMLTGGGLAASLAAASAGGSALAADGGVVRIGYLPITDATPLLVAYAKGFFAEEGLEAERPTLIRGWAPLVESFISRKFNLVHLLKPIPIWMRYNNQIPVKVVAWNHTNGSAVIVRPGIEGFADLGGKQVAVPFWYSIHNIILQMALRQVGLKPVIQPQGTVLAANEVNLQILPPPDMPPALAARKVDAYIVAEPFNALGELRAGGKVLRFTGDIWKNHPCCVVTMHEDALTERRAWSQKVVNATVKGAVYAANHREEVAGLLSRDGEGFLPVPEAVVQRAVNHYHTDEYQASGAIRHTDWGINRIDFQPWPYPSATRQIVEAMRDTLVGGDNAFLNQLDAREVARDLVDYELVRNALSSYPNWHAGMDVDPTDPFQREETIAL